MVKEIWPAQHLLWRNSSGCRAGGLRRLPRAQLGRFQSAHPLKRIPVFSYGSPGYLPDPTCRSAVHDLPVAPLEFSKSLIDLGILTVYSRLGVIYSPAASQTGRAGALSGPGLPARTTAPGADQ